MENSEAQTQPTTEQPVAMQPDVAQSGVEAPIAAGPTKNKMSKKTLYLICGGIVAVVVAIVAIILLVNRGGGDVVCEMEKSMFGASAKSEVRISFNKNGYAAHLESKIVADMGSESSDSTYEYIVRSISYSYYSDNKGNIPNSINIGRTSLGDNTKIERNGSIVTVTSEQDEGKGVEAGQDEIDGLIKMTENSGYTCKR